MKNDFDFIKEKFDSVGLNAPNELDSRVKQELENTNQVKLKLYQRKGFKVALSMVACLAIFVSALSIGLRGNDEPRVASAMDGVATFESYDELQKYMEKNNKREVHLFNGFVSKGDADAATDKLSINESEILSDDSASTYIQEQGVDEADVIKTVGNYVYMVSNNYWDNDYTSGSSRLFVFKVEGKKAIKINDIRFKGAFINEIYATNDTLTVIYTEDNVINDGANDSETTVAIYNAANPEKMEKISTFSQSGWYSSSRMIDGILYLVTNKDTYFERGTKPEEYIPYTCKNSGDKDIVKCDSITYPIDSTACGFTVVSAIDIKTGDKVGSTKAMLGWGSEIYCSTNSLYLYCGTFGDEELETLVAKIDLDKDLSVSATGKVKGSVNNQYSFSEKANHLCVFTTVFDDKDSNYLYVLDDKLEKVYTSKAFAVDESIKAVKYVGEYAYVITYEQTDPLFVIDLADVENPVFKGSVKISGFSQMLVDVGNDMLLGIGTSTHYGEDVGMEVNDGLKFALFDVSNPSNPKVLNAKEYKDVNSEAQYNSKAFVQNQSKGYYAVPTEDGAIVVAIENGKIIEKAKVSSKQGYSTYRVTYIGDNYFIADLDNASLTYFEV